MKRPDVLKRDPNEGADNQDGELATSPGPATEGAAEPTAEGATKEEGEE